jgi:hypothetical protein
MSKPNMMSRAMITNPTVQANDNESNDNDSESNSKSDDNDSESDDNDNHVNDNDDNDVSDAPMVSDDHEDDDTICAPASTKITVTITPTSNTPRSLNIM